MDKTMNPVKVKGAFQKICETGYLMLIQPSEPGNINRDSS